MKTTVEDILNILGEEHQVQFKGEKIIYQPGCVPMEMYGKTVKHVNIFGDVNGLEFLVDEDYEDVPNPRIRLGDQIILSIALDE